MNIYKPNGEIRADVPICKGSKVAATLMQEDYVMIKFSSAELIEFALGDYIKSVDFMDANVVTCDNIHYKYIITESQTPSYNKSTGGYDYELRFNAYYHEWNKYILMLPTVSNVRREASFSVTYAIEDHINLVLMNLKALGIQYEGADYEFYANPVSASGEVAFYNEYKVINYDKLHILDALYEIAKTYECDCWIQENIIYFGRCEHTSKELVRVGLEASTISANKSQNNIATRLFAYGSTKNVPDTYRKKLEFSVSGTSVEMTDTQKNAVKGMYDITDNARLLLGEYFKDTTKTKAKKNLSVSIGGGFKTQMVFSSSGVQKYGGQQFTLHFEATIRVVFRTTKSNITAKIVGTYGTASSKPVVKEKTITIGANDWVEDGKIGDKTIYKYTITDYDKYVMLGKDLSVGCEVNLTSVTSQFKASCVMVTRSGWSRSTTDFYESSLINKETQSETAYTGMTPSRCNITPTGTISIAGPLKTYTDEEKKKDTSLKDEALQIDFMRKGEKEDVRVGGITLYANDFNLENGVYVARTFEPFGGQFGESGTLIAKAKFENDNILYDANLTLSTESTHSRINTSIIKDKNIYNVVINPTYEDYSSPFATRVWCSTRLNTGDVYTVSGLIPSKVRASFYVNEDYSNVVQNDYEQRLLLPKESIGTYKGKGYVDAYENMPQTDIIEDVVVFEDIFPHMVSGIKEITPLYKENGIESTDAHTGEKVFEPWTYYRMAINTAKKEGDSYVYDPTSPILPFSDDYVISGEDLYVTFQSGLLNGMTFKVFFDPERKKEQIFEIEANEDYGRRLPDSILYPKVGDMFVLYGYDTSLVDTTLVPNAEKELLAAAEDYINKAKRNGLTYSVTLASDWVHKDVSYDENGFPKVYSGGKRVFSFGDLMTIVNNNMLTSDEPIRDVRVIGFEYPIDFYYDSPTYTLGESVRYSRLSTIEEKTGMVTSTGQSLGGGSGSGGGVPIIRTGEDKPAKDSNVFSALRSKEEFLSKKEPDSTPHVIGVGGLNSTGDITGENVEARGNANVGGKVSSENLEVKNRGDFGETIDSMISGRGTIIDGGRIQCDSLEVRDRMTVMDVVVNNIHAMDGYYYFSDAGTIESVEQIITNRTINGTSIRGARILTLKRNYENDYVKFMIGDILLSTNTSVEPKFSFVSSWMEVIHETGSEFTDDQGNVYSSMQILVRLIADSSGNMVAPEAGGNIVRRGNVNPQEYPERTSAWCLSSYDGSITYYNNQTKREVAEENFALVLGKLPDIPTVRASGQVGEVGIYCKTLLAQRLYQVSYKGDVIYDYIDEGIWEMGKEYVYERTIVTIGSDTVTKVTQSQVYHEGTKWGYVKEGHGNSVPSLLNTDWVVLQSVSNLTLSIDKPYTTLRCDSDGKITDREELLIEIVGYKNGKVGLSNCTINTNWDSRMGSDSAINDVHFEVNPDGTITIYVDYNPNKVFSEELKATINATTTDGENVIGYFVVKPLRDGANGSSVTILGSYETFLQLTKAHPTGNTGDAYMVGKDLYVWDGTKWLNVGQIKGNDGEPGPQGPNGQNGPLQRVFTQQKTKRMQAYRCDTNATTTIDGMFFLDFIAVEDQTRATGFRVYQCIKSYVALNAAQEKDPKDLPLYFKEVDANWTAAFFTNLIAKSATINMLTGSNFIIMDNNGNIVAGMGNRRTTPVNEDDEGKQYTFWSGGTSGDDCSFRIDYDGTMRAINGQFGGWVKGEPLLITADNILNFVEHGSYYEPHDKQFHLGWKLDIVKTGPNIVFYSDGVRGVEPTTDEVYESIQQKLYDEAIDRGYTKASSWSNNLYFHLPWYSPYVNIGGKYYKYIEHASEFPWVNNPQDVRDAFGYLGSKMHIMNASDMSICIDCGYRDNGSIHVPSDEYYVIEGTTRGAGREFYAECIYDRFQEEFVLDGEITKRQYNGLCCVWNTLNIGGTDGRFTSTLLERVHALYIASRTR